MRTLMVILASWLYGPVVPDRMGAVPCPDCPMTGCSYCQGRGWFMIDAGNATTTWARGNHIQNTRIFQLSGGKP